MKISPVRRRQLYRAINAPVSSVRATNLRDADSRADREKAEKANIELVNLQREIWRGIRNALNIEE